MTTYSLIPQNRRNTQIVRGDQPNRFAPKDINLQQVTDNGATTTNPITTGGLTTPYVESTTSYTPTGLEPIGTRYWNAVKGTTSLKRSANSTLDDGQELGYYVKARGAISNGQLVQFAGYQGDHYTAKVCVPAEVIAFPRLIMGIATEDIANGEYGNVTAFGEVTMNTTGWVVDDKLYFDNSTGQLTNVVPNAPERMILVGVVVKEETSPAAANGRVLTRITWGMSLEDLDNVDGADPDTTGDLLTYNVSGTWERNAYNITDYALTSSLSAYAKLDGSNHPFTYVKTPKIYPASDSTTALQILKADGTTPLMNFDTTNGYVGIGTTTPDGILTVRGVNNGGDVFQRIVNSSTTAGSTASLKFTVTSAETYDVAELIATRTPNSLQVHVDNSLRATFGGTYAFSTNGTFGIGGAMIATSASNLSLTLSGTTTTRSLTFLSASDGGYISGKGSSSDALFLGVGTGASKIVTINSTGVTTSVPVLTSGGTAGAPAHSFSADPNTGMYDVSADVLGFATAGTTRMQIGATGEVAVGTSPSTAIVFRVFNANTQLAATKSGIYVDGTHTLNAANALQWRGVYSGPSVNQAGFAASASTSSGGAIPGFYALPQATGASGTVTNVTGFFASPRNTGAGTVSQLMGFSKGASLNSGGGVVTNNYGYYGADETVGTNNYGYYSTMTAATGKWAFYSAGDANNYFAGNVGIGVAPLAKLHSQTTTEQLRLGYDASNYLSATVDSTGSITLALTGTTPKFTFSQAVKISTLTSGRIPFATTGGELIDDADLTFATDTLTATKIVGTTSIKVGTAGGFISSDGSTGATGSFTTVDSKTVTVKDGIITSIV